MGNIDWSNQPPWLLAMMFFGTGVVVPIALAMIGKMRSRPDGLPPPAPMPIQPVEIASPWMIQNMTELVMLSRDIKASIDALTKAISDMAVQINTQAALLKRRNRQD